jgi:hypothetical protein
LQLTNISYNLQYSPRRGISPSQTTFHERQTTMSEWGFEPNIIRLIRQRLMRWTGLVARKGDRRDTYRVLVGRQRTHLEDLG